MVSIPVTGTLVDVVVDNRERRIAVLTLEDGASCVHIFEEKASPPWSLSRRLRVAGTISNIVFVPKHNDQILILCDNDLLSTIGLYRYSSLFRYSARHAMVALWEVAIQGRIGPVAATASQVAVPELSTGEIHFHSIETGTRTATIRAPGTVTAIQFSPNDRNVAVGCAEGSIHVLTRDGDVLWQGDAKGSVRSLLYNHNFNQVLTATSHGELIFFNRNSSKSNGKEHSILSLSLQHIEGISEFSSGWLVWSRTSIVHVWNNLTFKQRDSNEQIIGILGDPTRKPVAITTDSNKTTLRLEFVSNWKNQSYSTPQLPVERARSEPDSSPQQPESISIPSIAEPEGRDSDDAIPNYEESNIVSATEWVKKGVAAYRSGKFNTAIEAFEMAIDADYQSSIAYYFQGEARYKKGDRERAEDEFTASIIMFGERPAVADMIATGCAAIRLREYECAIDLFSDALDIDPNNVVASHCIQIGRDCGVIPEKVPYPETIDFVGFPLPLHSLAGIQPSAEGVANEGGKRCFIMPGHSRDIQNSQKRLVYYTAALPPSTDATYRIIQGDIGYFFDHDLDALIGPFIAKSTPRIIQMPQSIEKISQPKKYRFEIPLTTGDNIVTTQKAKKIIRSFALDLKVTSTGELYLPSPVLEGDKASQFISEITLPITEEELEIGNVQEVRHEGRDRQGIDIEGTLIDVVVDNEHRKIALLTRDKEQALSIRIFVERSSGSWLLDGQIHLDYPAPKIHFIPGKSKQILLETTEKETSIFAQIQYSINFPASTVWMMTVPFKVGQVALSKYQIAFHVPSEQKLHVVKLGDESDATSLTLSKRVSALHFSEYGFRIVAGCDDGTVYVITNCCGLQWQGSVKGPVVSLLYNHYEDKLIVATEDGNLELFHRGISREMVSLPLRSVKGIVGTKHRWVIWSSEEYATVAANLTWQSFTMREPIVHVLSAPYKQTVIVTAASSGTTLHIDRIPDSTEQKAKVEQAVKPTARKSNRIRQPPDNDRQPFDRRTIASIKPSSEPELTRSKVKEPSGSRSDALVHSGLLERGTARYRSNEFASALDAFEGAIKDNSYSLIPKYFAAEVHLKLGQNERAEERFAAAIPPPGTTVNKDEALIAGFAAVRLHDYDRANDIFSKIHGADPKSTIAWHGLQLARDRGRIPDVISYPETFDVVGFPVPLHEIAGIRSYTPVGGSEGSSERYFIMPGLSRIIDACEEGLVYHTPVQRSVDSGYRVVQGDIGYFYDLGRDSLSGPYIATSAPHFAQLPPDPRSERASTHTKNGLAISLTTKASVEIIGNARKILDALGLAPEKTHTGETYLADPMLEGERATRFSRLISKSKAGSSRYKPGEYVTIVDGGIKGQRARVKEIDEEMDKIVVELDGVLLPMPIPLRIKQVSKERR